MLTLIFKDKNLMPDSLKKIDGISLIDRNTLDDVLKRVGVSSKINISFKNGKQQETLVADFLSLISELKSPIFYERKEKDEILYDIFLNPNPYSSSVPVYRFSLSKE